MTGADLIALLPILIPAYAGVALMCLVAFVRSPRLALWLTQMSLLGALGSLFAALVWAPRDVTTLIRIDAYSLFFSGLILATALLIALLSGEYLKSHEKGAEAFCVLLLFSVTGMLIVTASTHFASLFLGLETLSVSLYGLIGYTRRHSLSIEAATKYLIMAAVSSAFLAFGIALIYADIGTMEFALLAVMADDLSVTGLLGIGLALVGFGFKLAWAGFHTWSPDVYQGAPAPISALIATGSKLAVFALFLRLVLASDMQTEGFVYPALSVVAVATMFAGNSLALTQNNIKRLLAYSSIAQMGYLLIPLIAGGREAASSAAFYLVAYVAATVVAFGVISVISSSREMGDVDKIADYTGLSATNPWLAGALALSMLSLLGMPLTGGFFAKFYIFSAAARANLWWLLIIGVINTGTSAFYYLRVVFAVFSRPEEVPSAVVAVRSPWPGLALAIAAGLVVLLGTYPGPLVEMTRSATQALGF